uniref:Trans-golgi network integral membrane protein tgn38 n=2 Tax=Nyssomyia neivai TaxID=330878 RepID=A0A1L8D9Y7_9DIPT
MRNLLILVISVILSAAPHSAAPVSTQNKNPLLDDSILPVLKECSNISPKDTTTIKLCDLYVSIVKNATATPNLTEEFEAYSAAHPEENLEVFCSNFTQFNVSKELKGPRCIMNCGMAVGEDGDTLVVKPLCRLIEWQMRVQQKIGQITPVPGVTHAPNVTSTANGDKMIQENKEQSVKEPVAKGPYTQKPIVTPPGVLNSGADIQVVEPQKEPADGGTTSTKTLEQPPKEDVANKVPDVPNTDPEAKASKDPIKGDPPKPLEDDTKAEPELGARPDNDDDINEGFKDMEDDDAPEDPEDREDIAPIIKGNANIDPIDVDPLLDSSDPKENSMGDKMEVVDAKKDPFQEEDESNFFTYFMCMMIVCIVAYVVYHNKTKVLALVLEGRRSNQGRGRRKHTAAYRKLDSNLEEAITSSAASRTSQVIY